MKVQFRDRKEEKVTNNRELSELRDHNLMWYGQSEIKSNKMYLSFAKFNFLNTDAAMSLADSTSHLEEDLSKLLVGPEASETWQNIDRVYEALSSELKSLKSQTYQIEEDISAIENQMKKAKGIRHESDSIHDHLNKMVHKIEWNVDKSDKESFASILVEDLLEIQKLIEQLLSFNWIEPSISYDELSNYCSKTENTIKEIESINIKFEFLEKKYKSCGEAIKRNQETSNFIEQAENLIEANVPTLLETQSKQKKIILKYTTLLAGLDDISLDVLKKIKPDTSLIKCHENAVSRRCELEILLEKQKREYAEFSKARDVSFNLAQELRQIADKILKESPKADQCPLCHTQFKTGELVKHMTIDVDEHLETLGQSILSRMREQEEMLNSEIAAESALAWLMEYCKKAKLKESITVGTALLELEKANLTFTKAQSNLDKINENLLSLKLQGLSKETLDNILKHLHNVGHPLERIAKGDVEQLKVQIEQEKEFLSKTLEANRKQTEELRQTITDILDKEVSGIQDSIDALFQLKERLNKTKLIQSKLSEFTRSYPWPSERALEDLMLEATLIRQVAAELQTTLANEKQADFIVADSTRRKEALELKLDNLYKRKNRFSEAYEVLKDLKEEHSLETAMRETLRENRESIENIFTRIHSPAEFKRIGPDWNSLIRKDGNKAGLSQISTGQRAAFALSIFLSQNAQLKNAPPVILIDDPIAHVDDLNSLSFLDYLRELTLTNERQIFFATSNDKLATLFERKFDFLGAKDFRRFDLKRSSNSASLE